MGDGREIMKTIQFFICLLIVQFLSSCEEFLLPNKKTDIYAWCSKEDTLSFELFKRTERIIKTDKWYFVWVDLIDDDATVIAKHILVCDHNLVLKGASGKITSIVEYANGDTLYGFTNENIYSDLYRRSHFYRDDLPKEIVCKLDTKREEWSGYESKSLTLIDSIKFVDSNFAVLGYFRTSDSTSLSDRREYFKKIEYYDKEYYNKAKYEIPLSTLYFDRYKNYVYTIQKKNGANDIENQMLTKNDKVIETLLFDIWSTIKHK